MFAKNTIIIEGRYPRELLNAWKKYRAEFGSENDCPDIFGSEQYFLLIAYENGGVDLEKFQVYCFRCYCIIPLDKFFEFDSLIF